MSDEVLSTIEATIGESLESTSPPLETADSVVVDDPVPDETTVPVTEATETLETEFWDLTEPVETLPEETTETIVLVDYTPVFAESTSIVTNVILCGALMIVGVLCGIRFWR